MKKLLAVGLAALLLAGCSVLSTLEENFIDTLSRYTNRPGVTTQPADPLEEEPGLGPGGITNISGQGDVLETKGISLPEETPAPQPPTWQTGHTPIAKSERYGYRLLSGAAQTLYDRLYQAVDQCLNFVDIEDLEMTRSEFNRVFQYMVQDNPQFFYLSKSYQYRYYTDNTDRPVVIILQYFDGQTTDQIDSEYQRQATADRQRIYDQRVEFNRRVAEILSGISPAAGEFTKERIAHDAVLDATEYDYDAVQLLQRGAADSHAFSAYGALVEGRAVCEGYSEAFQHLLTQMGIECLIVIGESENQSHQWNMVRIGENYYHVDPTWNDTDVFAELGISNYFYFNMSDAMISVDHTIGVSGGYGYPLPQCNSSSAYYYNSTALRVGADGTLLNDPTAIIGNLVTSRSRYLILLFERGTSQTAMKDWMQNVFWGRGSEVLEAFEEAGWMNDVEVTPSSSFYSVTKWGIAVVPISYGDIEAD